MANENVTVVTQPPINVVVQSEAVNVQVGEAPAGSVTVEAGGGPYYPTVLVSPTEPTFENQGLWIQTFDNGDVTLWIEDGT